MMPTVKQNGFEQRASVAETGVRELKGILERHGLRVLRTGQENWLPADIHAAIRFDHNDPMVRAIRYMPDLLTFHPARRLEYWEVKVNTTPGTGNFTIEKACYDELMARAAKGERLVVAFKDVEGTWYANNIQKLVIGRDMSASRQYAQGSQTPYLLLPKSSALSLTSFLKT